MDINVIIEKLKNANLTLEVDYTPDEENIINIIEFLKTAERTSGRICEEEIIISNYTQMNCFDLALLIKMTYEFKGTVKIVKLKPQLPLPRSYYECVVRHFVIEFNGFYYDINGKHTKAELKEYCKKAFSWRGVDFKQMKETELATYMHTFQNTADELIKFCLSKIKVKQKANVAISTSNSTLPNTINL